MCASFRRASRALTQLYDQALRPLGLRATQFTVLQALAFAGEVSQGELGQLLVMDSTTLTRTLGLVRGRGWIFVRPGKDRRERLLRLTASGRRQLRRATPRWKEVQEQLRTAVGTLRWGKLLQLSNEVANTVTQSAQG
jgi:DNA-binding MarR family transcriptional regulator